MATGRISSLVMMQPLKSFKPFPVCSLIRIVSSTTPSSVSLVHCSTHDKSVHYLFSAPQSRSQQQTEILIYFLEKLAPVNDISVLWIFSPQMIIINDIYPGSSTHSKVVFREVLHPIELE